MARRGSKYLNASNTIKDEEMRTIHASIDNRALDIICRYVVSMNTAISRSGLMNLMRFIDSLAPELLDTEEKAQKVTFIRRGIEARLEHNLTDTYMIMSEINGGILDNTTIDLRTYTDLSTAEIDWVNRMVAESLRTVIIDNRVRNLQDICTRYITGDYRNKYAVEQEVATAISEVQNELRRSKNLSNTEEMFSLSDGVFEDKVIDTYNKLAKPNRKLITGMQGLNELLGGGFEEGRCYIFFGLPGEGKSTMLLNLIYQIKKYNRDFKTKDPTKRPCIVLLTMENVIEETVERLFAISTARERMIDFDPQTVIKMLREEGELFLTDDNPVDIIVKYKPSNSVDTGYLYELVEDLEDSGKEVIALFQDYIGRIRSTQYIADTRLEYGAVVDEFKNFAELKQIPIISASQLNRDASRHIDEGRKKNQYDLVKCIGRSNISESMLILNNTDGGFMLAPEWTPEGQKFMGIQRIKIRYNATDREYIYLPFLNNSGIKLIEDEGRAPVFRASMKAHLEDPTQFDGFKKSMYHTNPVIDITEEVKADNGPNFFEKIMINSPSIEEMENEESTSEEIVIEETVEETVEEAAFSNIFIPITPLIQPLIFMDVPKKKTLIQPLEFL